jgi:hypothetical protein
LAPSAEVFPLLTDLDTHLDNELPYALGKTLSDFVVSSGTGSTSANPTHTIGAVEARVAGCYSQQSGTSITHAASQRHSLYPSESDTGTVNVSGGSGVPDVTVSSATLLPLGGVDTAGGMSITAVAERQAPPVHPDSITRYDTLGAAVTALGSTQQRRLVINQRVIVASSVTVTSNITVEFVDGGMLEPASGVTVTINGPLIASPGQIFSGSGTVGFGRGSIKELLPQWWGAKADGSADDTSALNKSLKAGSDSQVRVLRQ